MDIRQAHLRRKATCTQGHQCPSTTTGVFLVSPGCVVEIDGFVLINSRCRLLQEVTLHMALLPFNMRPLLQVFNNTVQRESTRQPFICADNFRASTVLYLTVTLDPATTVSRFFLHRSPKLSPQFHSIIRLSVTVEPGTDWDPTLYCDQSDARKQSHEALSYFQLPITIALLV
jgi:hypothetical protein